MDYFERFGDFMKKELGVELEKAVPYQAKRRVKAFGPTKEMPLKPPSWEKDSAKTST